MESRKWCLKKHFDGLPKLSDFEMVTETVRPLEDGGKKFRNLTILLYPLTVQKLKW